MIFQNNFYKKFLIVSIIVAGIFQISFAQELSVDDIINKNIEARGGIENWNKVKTIKMSGTYVNFSKPVDFVIYRQRPNLYRFESERLNQFTIHAYDGKNAWWVNPLLGEQFTKPSTIPNENNLDKVTLRERFFEPVFWNYKAKGNKVELIGKEDLDGDEVYKIKVTLKDKSTEIWFINSDTFLAVSMTGITYDFGMENDLDAFFSDYRDVDGILMPFLIESEYGIRYRNFEVNNIEINKNVDDEIFKMPDPKNWQK